ncbi:MAG: pyruvate, phosphate dikinase, partial [Myxococcales bacterium]|nr:pyruvate, phosphate dikinase [Myxococcales bacterium]
MGVYVFGFSDDIGKRSAREFLGGKGAGLREMVGLGIPVPPGFTISTETCKAWNDAKGQFPKGLTDEVKAAMAAMGQNVGRTFGDAKDPLLVSVRSGAAASMPGMMDTILNL